MTRIVTYNVHRCVGNDRRLDVPRVAEVLAALNPDIVALQELDVGRRRTRQVDQAHEIARRLQMACHFHPAFRVEDELYGDALLTSLPERLVRRGPLPGHDRIRALEPRGAVSIEVTVDGAPLQVINTHLGLVPSEQQRQAAALAGREWLQHPARRDPLILLGDFNATASSVVSDTESLSISIPGWLRRKSGGRGGRIAGTRHFPFLRSSTRTQVRRCWTATP